MKIRYLPLILIASLLLLVGAVAAGCGSDDDNGNGGGEPLTLDEWFGKLEALSQTYTEDIDSLDTEAGDKFDDADSEDDMIGVFTDFVNDMRSTADDFIGDIDNLGAPDEVADAHAETITAGQELVELYEAALIIIDLSDTFEDATFALEAPGFVDADERFGAACRALQEIADSNDIGVDLRCPS